MSRQVADISANIDATIATNLVAPLAQGCPNTEAFDHRGFYGRNELHFKQIETSATLLIN